MIARSLISFTQGEWGEPELIYFSTELKAIKDDFIHYPDHSLCVSVFSYIYCFAGDKSKQQYCFSDT